MLLCLQDVRIKEDCKAREPGPSGKQKCWHLHESHLQHQAVSAADPHSRPPRLCQQAKFTLSIDILCAAAWYLKTLTTHQVAYQVKYQHNRLGWCWANQRRRHSNTRPMQPRRYTLPCLQHAEHHQIIIINAIALHFTLQVSRFYNHVGSCR